MPNISGFAQNQIPAGFPPPLHTLTHPIRPSLFIHGDKDALVPYCQSKELNEALKKAGVRS
jgi:predicted esterase